MFTLLFIPAALAATGDVHVSAPDAPGEIILDGMPTGEHAPALLEGLPTGSHELSLSYGCLAGSTTVQVTRKATARVTLQLDPVAGQGTVRLVGLPRLAQVALDGQDIEAQQDGFSAPCGAHTLTLRAPGFEPYETRITVTTDQWTQVPLTLVTGALDEGAAVSRPARPTGALDEAAWDDTEAPDAVAEDPGDDVEVGDPDEDLGESPVDEPAISDDRAAALDRLEAARLATAGATGPAQVTTIQTVPPDEPPPSPRAPPEPRARPVTVVQEPPPPERPAHASTWRRDLGLTHALLITTGAGLGYGLYHHAAWLGAQERLGMVRQAYGATSTQAASFEEASVSPQHTRMLIGYAVAGLGAVGIGGMHMRLTGTGLVISGVL